MSNNSMQRIADLEAQVAQLTAQRDGLQRQLNSQPNYTEILGGIAAHISREMQITREDFTGKFAGHILPAVTNFKTDVEKTQQQQEQIEQRQTAFELRLQKHKAEIEDMLKESNTKQTGTMKRFIEALKAHNDRLDGLLDEQQETVNSINHAAGVTAQAATLCINFKKDYEETAKLAKREIDDAAKLMRKDLSSFTHDIKEKAESAVEPAMHRLRNLSESQMEWRIKWSVFGFVACAFVLTFIAWFASPTPYIMRDASRWRTWEAGFTREQADQLNKMIDQFNKENSAKEGGK